MKTKLPQLLLWLLGCSSIFSFHSWSQSVITSWNFNDGTTATTIGNGVLQTVGNLNTAFPTSSFGKCLQLSNFANQSSSSGTRGIQLSVNTTGYASIVLNFSQRASSQASRWRR
jgi:hypothetical protein